MRILIDMDNTICAYNEAISKVKEENPRVGYPQMQWGFFRNLEPLPNAIESVLLLAEHHEVEICTRPSMKNLGCWTEKAEWCVNNLGEEWVENITVTAKKDWMDADILIDDHDWPDFKGVHIKIGSEKWPDWKTIIENFFELKLK